MSENAPKKRSIPLWAWIVTLVVVAALGVGGTLFFTRDKDSGEEPSVDETAEVPGDLKVAEACFGGEDAYDAIKSAQTELPGTDKGAATFTASFSRWILEYPVDPEMDSIAKSLFENGTENGEFADLPTQQTVDPTLVTRRVDTSTSEYAIYMSAASSQRWIVQIKQNVVSKYNDAPDSTVEITDAFAVARGPDGNWKFLRSYSEEEQKTILPNIGDDAGEKELIPFSNPCRGDLS